MRKLAAVVLAAAFFAGVAVASLDQRRGLTRPLVLRAPAVSSPLLGLTYGRLETWLTRLDPKTLRTRGRWLSLSRYAGGWSFSPDRRMLAFGNQPSDLNDTPAAIRLVDARRVRLLRDIQLGLIGYVPAVLWASSDRLLAVVRGQQSDALVVVDAAAARVVQRQDLPGAVSAIARANGALVLLFAGPRYGPVRLAVADGAGTLRSVTLDRVRAGVHEAAQPDGIEREDRAGVAVDSRGGRAYVVAARDPVAEVDLDTLAVAYHSPARSVSALARLPDWLEPPAQAKGAWEGAIRYATWLGDGRLAVFGRDGSPYSRRGRVETILHPSGLEVIDTGSWNAAAVDRRASSLVVGDKAMLSWGRSWDSAKERETGTGLSVYDRTGRRRFHLFGARPLFEVQVVGGRAFVRRANVPNRYTVVNLRTGRLLQTIRGSEMPLVLSGAGSAFTG
jgi:hypothetical protein